MGNIDKHQILIIALAIVLLGGFAVLRYIPLAGKTREIKAARAEFQQGDQEIKKQARQIPVLKAKIEKIESDIGDYQNRVPSGRQFAAFYDEIGAIMNKHNLSGQLIKPGRETAGKTISSIPITINCSGQLKDVFEFFRSIETFNRLIRIENVLVQNKVNTRVVDVKAVAMVYYHNR